MADLSAKTQQVKGVYINRQHQKMVGVFEIPVQYLVSEPDFQTLQWTIYLRKNKNECYVLTPDNTLAFAFSFKGEQFIFKSVKNFLGLKNPFQKSEKKIFLNTIVDGKISLLNIFHAEKGNSFSYGTSYYLEKGGQVFRLSGTNYKRQLKKIFSRNPEFLALLKEKRYKKKDLPGIIRYFNENYSGGIFTICPGHSQNGIIAGRC